MTAFARAETAGSRGFLGSAPGKADPAVDPRALCRDSEHHRVAAPLRRYELSTTGGTEVLMRVIGLVRKHCGEVVALDFHGGDRHRPPTLDIAVAVDRRHGPTLALRLAALLDVLDVREY